MNTLSIMLGIGLLATTHVAEALAWGATGHEWVSGIAVEKLPDSVPAFVRTPEAAAEIAVMGRELDRSKGYLLSFRVRSRASLELELVALRHQVAVLHRQRPGLHHRYERRAA